MLRKTLCCLALLMPMAASADVYQCKTTNFGQGGWIVDTINVDFNAKTGKATALDGIIKEVHGKPIRVDFEVRSETSYNFRWTISGAQSSNAGSSKLTYKLTLFTDRNRFILNGRLHGYDNAISGSGTCKRVS